MNRRTFVASLAGLTGGLLLPRRGFGRPVPPPRRLVIVMQNNGTQQANFWPQPSTPGGLPTTIRSRSA